MAANINNVPVPTHFRCPISLDLMRDPVTACTGITYDRESIEKWLDMGNASCPATNQRISSRDELIPNHALRRLIQDWCVAHRAHGVERIPTPRIPLSKIQATQILTEVGLYGVRGDALGCSKLVAKLKALGKESERNKAAIVSCGGARVLAAVFREFSGEGIEGTKLGFLEEILSALVFFSSPLDTDARDQISSSSCLKTLISILNHGSISGTINTVVLLRRFVPSLETDAVNSVAKTNGLLEGLAKLVQRPISGQATKAALTVMYHLISISTDERTGAKFATLGIVPTLVELMIDCDRSTCEKALGVLAGLLSSEKGRNAVSRHALTVPVLTKKVLRVSDLATDFAVSALWALCKGDECCAAAQAIEAGLFRKLLFLVQIGCTSGTKQKASDLLKVLNSSVASRVEAVECVDFRGIRIKRQF